MATEFDIDEQAQRATTGTQAFTGTLNGETGVCAITLASRATALATVTADAEVCTGFQVGAATEQAFSSNADDGAAPSFKSSWNTSHAARHTNLGSATLSDAFIANATAANGLTMNLTTASGTQYRTVMGMFGGTELSSAVQQLNEGTTAANSTFAVTGVGFQPQAIVTLFAGGSGATDNFIVGVGVAVDNGAGTDQYCAQIRVQEGGGTSIGDAAFLTNRIVHRLGTGSITNSWELTSWDSDGITVTVRDNAGTSRVASALFLSSSDWDFVCGQSDLPTSGTRAVTGLGIDPEFLLNVWTNMQTADAHINNSATATAMSVGLVSGSSEYSVSGNAQHNSATPACKSITEATSVLLSDAGAIDVEGTHTLDTDGFTTTFSNFPGTASKAFYLAGGPATGAGGGLNILRRRRM